MDMIALRFEPYGIGQFHENAFALRNQAIPLDKVFSNTRQLIDLARQDLALNVFAEKALSLIMVQRREPYGYMLVKNACNQFLRTPTLTPDDLSKVARCSQRTLNRHFKRVCGLTVSEFVRINRFQTARQAIKYGDTSLSDVAALAGYVDQAHMTRAFKALAGLTPHQMRSRLTFDDLYQNRPDILLADNSNGTA